MFYEPSLCYETFTDNNNNTKNNLFSYLVTVIEAVRPFKTSQKELDFLKGKDLLDSLLRSTFSSVIQS